MRELYRVYGDCPEAITLAEQIGWTQNVMILEADLDLSLRLWYMRATRQFGWTKVKLITMIENEAHMIIVLDNGQEVYDNENNEFESEIISPMVAVKYLPAGVLRLIRHRFYGASKIGWRKCALCYVRHLWGNRTLLCGVRAGPVQR